MLSGDNGESLKDVELGHDMFRFVFQRNHAGGTVAMNGRVRLELGKMVRRPIEWSARNVETGAKHGEGGVEMKGR